MREAEAGHAQLKAKYIRAVEAQSEREADCRAKSDALAQLQQQLAAGEHEAAGLRAALAAQRAEADEQARRALGAAEGRAAQAEAERQAAVGAAAALRAQLEQAGAVGAAQLDELRKRQEAELLHVEERVRQAMASKDGVIDSLQAQLSQAQQMLHSTQQQLHSTQQEILSLE